jgi:hypothetical protein
VAVGAEDRHRRVDWRDHRSHTQHREWVYARRDATTPLF